MTVSCFATPLNGLHRIDTYDASVSVSSKTATVSDVALKSQIVEATLKSTVDSMGIKGQVAKLNAFLGAKGVVTLEQYKAYLVSGDIAKLGVLGLTETKKPVFFEARAMIQGNVCMNRMHGIGYPVLGFPGAPAQPVDLPVDLDGRTIEGDSGNVAASSVEDLAAGVNPIVVAMNMKAKTEEPPEPSNPSAPTTKPGGTITDGPVPTPVTPTPGTPVPGGTTTVPTLNNPVITPTPTPLPGATPTPTVLPGTTPTPTVLPGVTPAPNPFGV